MGDLYDENGEVLDFLGSEETQFRGTLETDEVGRWRLVSDGSESGDLASLMPDGVEHGTFGYTDSEGEELVFWVDVTVHRPTGEFQDGCEE